MNNKHYKTLNAIFRNPISPSIVWREIETMLIALGAVVEEAEGSRIVIELNGIVSVFHRPHPRKETDKGALKSLRRFLNEAGVYHDRV